MVPVCMAAYLTNILPGPTYLTKNPDGENNFFCFGVMSQKSGSDPWYDKNFRILWDCFSTEALKNFSHLRDKGGVLTLIYQYWACADPYSKRVIEGRPFGFAKRSCWNFEHYLYTVFVADAFYCILLRAGNNCASEVLNLVHGNRIRSTVLISTILSTDESFTGSGFWLLMYFRLFFHNF